VKGVMVWEMPDDVLVQELALAMQMFRQTHPGFVCEIFLETEHNRQALMEFFDALLQRVREPEE
jgi:hypothetical protein